ncbi:MAG: flagellin [Syntrophaceae bacterium]
MALRINTNVGALNAHQNLVTTERAMNKSMAKLSSGYRINNAGDDAAGLVEADSLRATIRANQVQLETISRDKAGLAINEGDVNTIEGILERMAELAAKNDSGGPSSDEWDSLVTTMDAIGYSGLTSTDLSVGTYTSTIATVTSAIDTVTEELGSLGAQMNAKDFEYDNMLAKITNQSASESAIRDVDMASEMVTFTKTQIMMQAGTAMLAQANTSAQTILSLFR